MADLSFPEMAMFAKYYKDYDLINNDQFWMDCLMIYPDKVVPLPLVDNPESRRRLSDLLECKEGDCGLCCHYASVPLSKTDIKRLEGLDAKVTLKDGQYILATGDSYENLITDGRFNSVFYQKVAERSGQSNVEGALFHKN